MNKLKKIILAGIGSLALLSCTTIKPTGSIDIAYVPERMNNNKEYENELMVELDLGLTTKIGETNLTIGGRQRTFSLFSSNFAPIWFSPDRQEYDFYGMLDYLNWRFYMMHTCEHLVDKLPLYEFSDITKFGIKFKF